MSKSKPKSIKLVEKVILYRELQYKNYDSNYVPPLFPKIVLDIPGPPVSSLSGLPVLFYQRTNHLFCCVNQTTESWLHNEVYETCNQTERRAGRMDGKEKER